MEDFEVDDRRDVELKALRRKNRRRNAFLVLMVLQMGSLALSYYLGRSHK
ncbi:hypothetical protein JGH11_09865 [Dysgonomonas sp. Marseille-P4677]|nr:hypothetical protein [Dysgonomonas sp. Marseille-P4677]MBK5721174.1 hypothetical protein [Dysgonomonas sp. Marseille-P4677]